MKPLHEHDCTSCIYLGSDDENDYYFHRNEEHVSLGTLICRYSSDGWDYSSGEDFCMCNPGINKALELAYTKGILNPAEITWLGHVQQRALDYFITDPEYKKRIDERWEGLTRFLLP